MKRFLSTILGLTLLAQTAVAQTPRVLDGDKVSRTSSTRNYVRNPDAMLSATTGVTLTNATASKSTTTPVGETGTEFNIAITSANGTIDFLTSGASQSMLGGQSCEVGFMGRGFQATSKLQVFDGTNVLASFTFGALTNTTPIAIPFPCPLDPSTVRVRITDTAILSGTNEVAGVYLGKSRNIGTVAQATFAGGFDVSALGSRPSTTSASFAALSGGVATATLLGSASSFTQASGAVTFNDLPAGRYQVLFEGLVYPDSAGTGCRVSMRETTSNILRGNAYGTFSTVETNGLTLPPVNFEFTSAGARTFRIEVQRAIGSGACQLEFTSGAMTGGIKVYRFPTASEQVVTPSDSTGTRVRYTSNAGQSLANNTDTILNFEDLVSDTNSEVVTGASWKFTAKKSGYYRIHSAVLLGNAGAWNTGEVFYLDLRKNGSTFARSFYKAQAAFSDNPDSVDVDSTIFLNTGEFIDVVGNQGSGASVPIITNGIYNFIDIESVDGPTQPVFIQSPVKAAATGVAPIAGEVGEQILDATTGSNALVTGVPETIVFVTLTPGVWDISAVAEFDGSPTGTQVIAGVSTATNSFTGAIQGNSLASLPTMPTAASDVTLSLPQMRKTITSTTTFYLVARSTFSAGSIGAFGRISAVRVGDR